MKLRTKELIIMAILLIGLFLFLLATQQSGAHENKKRRHHDDHPACQEFVVEKNYCGEIDPTPTPTATPEAELTPTPEPGNGGTPPTFAGSSTESPAPASCTIGFAAPIVQGYLLHKDGVQTYSWWPSTEPGIEKQSVVYGYEIGHPLYGVDNLSPEQHSIDLIGLDSTKISWLQVIAWKHGCPSYSNWFN